MTGNEPAATDFAISVDRACLLRGGEEIRLRAKTFGAPQCVHAPPEQTFDMSAHVVPLQHGDPAIPHDRHEPETQSEFAARQLPPAQHASARSPHERQTPPWHERSGIPQALPTQQG